MNVRDPVAALGRKVRAVTPATFLAVAKDVYAYQRAHNPVYREYLTLTGQLDASPASVEAIPCAPISLFRTHDVRSGTWEAETHFRSSGTTGRATSRHSVADLGAYRRACARTFARLVAPLAEFELLALLPNYLEQEHSGLVAMVEHFVAAARPGSGFHLDDLAALRTRLAARSGGPVVLWGVTFALLDLVDGVALTLPEGSLVIETGGMKGRGEEPTREALHRRLRERIRYPDGAPVRVGSEYGMTELLSQAYLVADDRFAPAETLRIRVRDLTDPLVASPPETRRGGALNLYDLANYRTLSFIQSDDLGRVDGDERFEVRGRIDRSVVRGCSQLYV